MKKDRQIIVTEGHRRLTHLVLTKMREDRPIPLFLLYGEPGLGKSTWIREHLAPHFGGHVIFYNLNESTSSENLYFYNRLSYDDQNRQRLETLPTDAVKLLTSPGNHRRLLVLEEIHTAGGKGALTVLNALGNSRPQLTVSEGNLGTLDVPAGLAAVVMTSNEDPHQFLNAEFVDRCTVVHLDSEALRFFSADDIPSILDLSHAESTLRRILTVLMDVVLPCLTKQKTADIRFFQQFIDLIESFLRYGDDVANAVRIAFEIQLGGQNALVANTSAESLYQAFLAKYKAKEEDDEFGRLFEGDLIEQGQGQGLNDG
jgi:MoxR-like ATPase